MRCEILKDTIIEYKTYFTTHPIEKELIINTINRRTRDGFYGISFLKNEELTTKLTEMIDRVYKVNRLLSCYIDYKQFDDIINCMDELGISFLSSIKLYNPLSFIGYLSNNGKGTHDENTIALISTVVKQLEVMDMLCKYTTIKSFDEPGSINKTNMMMEMSEYLLNQLKSIKSFMVFVTKEDTLEVKECDG